MTWYENASAPWIPVSEKLIPARLLTIWIWMIPGFVAGIVLALVLSNPWPLLATAAALIFGVWFSWLAVRQVKVHAWAEGEDDLLVRKGRLFRTVTVVPYGRMQYVEVSAGPIARRFGIAEVQLHTASSGTDASISGVPADEAAALRDRLTARGEARLAGL